MHLLTLALFWCVSCNGQNPTRPQETTKEPTATAGGQPKLTKTQGTDKYQNVHCSLQDKQGNLWFGTTGEGAYRYDGKTFTQFTVKEGLSNNKVWAMLEDASGNIWFGTAGGLSRYDGKSMQHIPIVAAIGNPFFSNGTSNSNPPARNEVWSMLQDKSGTLWFGAADGVYCYNGKAFTRFLDNDSIVNKEGLHLKMVACMLQDKNGNIWFGSGMPPGEEGLCRYDGKSLTRFRPGGDGWIRHLLEDRNGTIWSGGRHRGVWRYDGKDFNKFTEKEGIGSPVLVDQAGNIWFDGGEKPNSIESNAGLWRYDGHTFKNFSTPDGLENYSAWSILEDRSGNIWVGTRNMGLYRYDGKTFTRFSE